MNAHDLHEQLERLGRQPVPPPRPEFVENLLARVQLADDLSAPAPVVDLQRHRWARVRMAVVGAAAAAVVGLVGFLALAQGGGDGPAGQRFTEVVIPASDSHAEFSGEVGEDGGLGEGLAELDDGDYPARCTQGGELAFQGGSLQCRTADEVWLRVEDGRIVNAWRDEDAPEVEQPPTTTPTTAAQDLGLGAEQTGNGGVRLSWDAYAGSGQLDSYVVLRTAVAEGEDRAELVYPATDGRVEVARTVSEPGKTSITEGLGALPADTHEVAYRVVAVDAQGAQLATSSTLVLTLSWSGNGNR